MNDLVDPQPPRPRYGHNSDRSSSGDYDCNRGQNQSYSRCSHDSNRTSCRTRHHDSRSRSPEIDQSPEGQHRSVFDDFLAWKTGDERISRKARRGGDSLQRSNSNSSSNHDNDEGHRPAPRNRAGMFGNSRNWQFKPDGLGCISSRRLTSQDDLIIPHAESILIIDNSCDQTIVNINAFLIQSFAGV